MLEILAEDKGKELQLGEIFDAGVSSVRSCQSVLVRANADGNIQHLEAFGGAKTGLPPTNVLASRQNGEGGETVLGKLGITGDRDLVQQCSGDATHSECRLHGSNHIRDSRHQVPALAQEVVVLPSFVFIVELSEHRKADRLAD